MITALFCLCAAPSSLKVLFLGNSHTAMNDLPGMVRQILQADSQGPSVTLEVRTGGNLEALARDQSTFKRIAEGRFTHVVLQGAALSSSHKYRYSQEGAVKLSRASKKAGAEVMLFAEWPRKGWKETDYILGIYKEIAKESTARIIPVCSVFDRLLASLPKLDLWQGDGNHASHAGSFVAALTIAKALNPRSRLLWKPKEVPESLRKSALNALRGDSS